MNSLSRLLDEFPPVLCRLLAREGGWPPTSWRLAVKSGLSRDRVLWLSIKTGWLDVKVGEALHFMEACGVDVCNAKRQREFIKRNNWSHLDRAVDPAYHGRLMRLYIQTLNKRL